MALRDVTPPLSPAVWDAAWGGATASAVGTAYGSMSDSATVIRTALARAKTLGIQAVVHGRFRVDSTITIDSDADLGGATFICSDTSLAPVVRVGTATSGEQVRKITVALPKIEQAAKTGAGWTGASVGVELANLYESDICIPHIKYFSTGVLLTAYGATGCVYNTIRLGHLENNQVNLRLEPDDSSAWVNENVFVGGRLSHNATLEGSETAGIRQIELLRNGGSPPNNNLFVKPSLEGDAPEYHLYVRAAVRNRILQGRWETTVAVSPKVAWDEDDASNFANLNVIDGGYDADRIVETFSTNSRGNEIYHPNRTVRDGSSTTSLDRVRNRSSSTAGVRRIYPATANPALAADDAEWQIEDTASEIRFKVSTDANYRMRLTNTGQMHFGNGTAATDSTIKRIAANIVGTDTGDKWVANAGLGVGNSAVASSLGTVTRKMEVFDAAGNSLGFVPIYDAIT